MGMGDIIEVLWKGYGAWSRGLDLSEYAVNLAGLEVASAKIEENQKRYINDKSEANVIRVKTDIILIRDYLRSLQNSGPSVGQMFNLESTAKYQVQIAISNYASELLFKLEMAISSGELPEIDDRPWSQRRGGYIRLRDGSRQMAFQFEAVVRNKQNELKEITSYEARLFALAFSQDVTDGDLQMIQAEMNQQKADEDSTVRTITVFALLANGARKNYERFSAIIDAGDKNGKK